jgi:hypothetical protein
MQVPGPYGRRYKPSRDLRDNCHQARKEQLNGFTDFCLKKGSRQGLNTALNDLFVSDWYDSGTREPFTLQGYLAHKKRPPPRTLQ